MFEVDWVAYAPGIFDAGVVTVKFTAASFGGAVVAGFILAVSRLSKARVVRFAAQVITEALKNIPPLTILFVVYFGLGSATDINLGAFEAGAISLAVAYSAYLAEIFRASLEGVHWGQLEAGQAVGLGRMATMRYVILPQAVRTALPGTGTMLVDMVKATSLLVTVGAGELMTAGQLISAATFHPLEVYIVIGLLYFALCFPLSRLVLLLERTVKAGTPISKTRRSIHRYVKDLHAENAIAKR